MCRCDVELLSFQVHSIPAPFTQPCCGRKFTCTPNTTAVISCDSTAIPVGQRGFTVPEKRMNQSMLWWLVDFSHTKIVLCLKYIPHEMKHEWGWDCFPAPKWISNLFCCLQTLCLSVGSAVGKEVAVSRRERGVRLLLCGGSLKMCRLLWMAEQEETCLQEADPGSLRCLAFSVAANSCFILPYPVLSFPPGRLGSHPSMTAEQTNPNAGQNCCSARHAILFSLGN